VRWKEREGDGSEDLNKGEERFFCAGDLCIYRTLLAAQKEKGPQYSLSIIAYLLENSGFPYSREVMSHS